MRFLLASLCLAALSCVCFAEQKNDMLKCFECTDCKEDAGTPRTCSINQDACMKVILGDKIIRRCTEESLCGLGKAERAANRAWTSIVNTFRDVDKDTELVYCCDDDYCNGAITHIPSLLVLLIPMILVSLFKY